MICSGPRPLNAATATVTRAIAIVEGGVYEVPPIADPQQIGAFQVEILIWGPDWLGQSPLAQVFRDGAGDAATTICRSGLMPRYKQHPVLLRGRVPEDEGITPVVHFVVFEIGQQDEIKIFCPAVQVGGSCAQDYLGDFAAAMPMVIVAGVIEMEEAVFFDNAAGVYSEIALAHLAAWQGDTVILVSDEVLSCKMRPIRIRHRAIRVARIMQVVNVIHAFPKEGNHIAQPGVFRFVEQLHSLQFIFPDS